MQSNLKQRTRKEERQTKDNFQIIVSVSEKIRPTEDEEFAAQIQSYEAWQAAIWLDWKVAFNSNPTILHLFGMNRTNLSQSRSCKIGY